MTIHLSNTLQTKVQAAVHSGLFTSVDDAIAEALQLLFEEQVQKQPSVTVTADAGNSMLDPILGLMRNDTELMDEIVADAYRLRQAEACRSNPH
jgi:Arc/MetJ-type ribon-helix-helix transcriptional regulator